MDRINFYQLLELPINPPENDAQVITEAIKRKQMAWSRLRNHPTKGIQARHYISLLPEIQKVMADSELRKQEAEAALEDLKKRLETIFKAVDRHIDLIGSKGDISSQEIDNIAARHDIKPQMVQKRVARWQKRRGSPAVLQIQHQLINGKLSDQELDKIAEQYGIEAAIARKIHQQLLDQRQAELDDFINIQVRKGYMTQAEISGLAAVLPFDEGEILRRIRCPIKKAAKKEETQAYQMDSTVEQVIIENLKIVGQDSLYSFLGLFPGTSLEALQNKAVEKENEIRKISQKDAVLTASGVLVGQCISIFKSDESRYAYDLSRARLLLKKLNADIDLAATSKNIPREQYNFLMRQAIRFGALPEEAHNHIREYCQSKGLNISLPKKKINYKRYFLVAAVVLLIISLGGGSFWFIYYRQQRIEYEYLNMLAEASRQKTLEGQLGRIEKYIKQQQDQEYIERAQKDIDGLYKRIEFRDLKKMQKEKDAFEATQEYEKIATSIRGFMTKHPQSAHNPKLQKTLDQLPELIDKRDFKRVLDIPPKNYAAVATALSNYQSEHPKGRHIKEVDQIAKRIAKPYYQQLVRELKTCEKDQQWDQCIALSAPYIGLFKDSRYAVRLKKRRDGYERSRQGQEIMVALRTKAGGPDAEPAVLAQAYRTYLAQNPYSPARDIIKTELGSLEAELGRQNVQAELKRLRRLLPQTKGRFREKAQETVLDTKTGLTWSMIDSGLDKRECMTFEEATQYVSRLKTGGHMDWRMPTVKELQAFYSGSNPFKTKSARWYWSADKIRRYSGEWVILVDVVAPSNHGNVKKRVADECGWARAVRR